MTEQNDETLVAGLCKAAGRQGGTIHQYMGRQDWGDMSRAYLDFRRMGIEFPTRAAFAKLARQYHLIINWD